MTREQAENRVAWSMAYQYAGLAGMLTTHGSGWNVNTDRRCAISLHLDRVYANYDSEAMEIFGLDYAQVWDVAREHDNCGHKACQELVDGHAEEGCQEWGL